jgi:hypothetical protein
MNTNHALHIGSRFFILAALTVLAAACGASPDDPSSVDEKSLTEPAADPDAAAPSGETTPAPSSSPSTEYGPVPQGNHSAGPTHGGFVPTHAPGEPRGE